MTIKCIVLTGILEVVRYCNTTVWSAAGGEQIKKSLPVVLANDKGIYCEVCQFITDRIGCQLGSGLIEIIILMVEQLWDFLASCQGVIKPPYCKGESPKFQRCNAHKLVYARSAKATRKLYSKNVQQDRPREQRWNWRAMVADGS